MLSVLLVSIQFTGKWRSQTSCQAAKRNLRRLEGEWELGSSYEAFLVSLGEVAFTCVVDMHLCQPSFHSSSNYWCRVWGPKAGAAHWGMLLGLWLVGGVPELPWCMQLPAPLFSGADPSCEWF